MGYYSIHISIYSWFFKTWMGIHLGLYLIHIPNYVYIAFPCFSSKWDFKLYSYTVYYTCIYFILYYTFFVHCSVLFISIRL